MKWELAKLSDESWSVRFGGTEMFVLPPFGMDVTAECPDCGEQMNRFSDRLQYQYARNIERMLNALMRTEARRAAAA